MASELGIFGKIARDLSRNPLGIIALFIVLIYGLAVLVLWKTASVLTIGQGYIFVSFLAAFPFVVLAAFVWLVSQHHAKLYAPSDFKSDEAFLQTLTPAEKLKRLEREIESEQVEPVEFAEALRASANMEQRHFGLPSSDIISKLRKAEDLAFQKLETELKHPIQREVRILGTGDLGVFDGVIVEPDKMTLIEVKYSRGSFLPSHIVRDVLYRAALAVQKAKEVGAQSNIRLLFVMVTEQSAENRERLKKRMDTLLKDSLVPVEVRFYDFDQLSREQQNS